MTSKRLAPTQCRAVFLVETCVSIMLMGVVLGVVSHLLTQYARSTDYFLNYRRVQMAAESSVDRLRSSVLAVESATFTDRAGIVHDVHVDDADEAWAPLRRVRVTATFVGKHGRRASYELRTYMLCAAGPEEAGQ